LRRYLVVLVVVLCLGAAFAQPGGKAPVDYVKPNIGGIGILLQPTEPFVQLPFSMARLAPVMTPGFRDRYVAPSIYGFPAGGASFLPMAGEVGKTPGNYGSRYDHDLEISTPYYCSELLEDNDTRVEYTVAQRAGYYRVTFTAKGPRYLMFRTGSTGEISQSAADAISGFGDNDGVRSYFYAVLSVPFSGATPWSDAASETRGLRANLPPSSLTVELRIGISFISADQARRNLEQDIPNWGFDRVKSAAREAWSRALGQIAVRGGDERQRTIFYTALYRSMNRMVDITEAGGFYKGFDGQTHTIEGHHFYTDDGLWDTYRSLHPLQLLLDPGRQLDMVRSYLRMYEQTGWLASFPTVGAERAFMIGHHAAPFIVDTYVKGYHDFDVLKAYEAMRKNAMEATMLPWRRGPLTDLDRVYQEKGFFPALAAGEKESVSDVHPSERRQAVSVTLENAYDDWAVAQLAKALQKDDDYTYFSRRGQNYRNLYNPANGFMSPRTADGAWVEPFDPKLGGGQGGRDYFAECNSWTYTFHVQQDVAGLIDLMGGRSAFRDRLDRLFAEPYGTSKFDYLKQFPDCTGNIGQYAQGNEPSFHIPYLYAYVGEPWKTQKRVREIMDIWYGDGPLGIPGDDDGGATSSWYVFSAIGFYPVTPGTPDYVIGSPIFEETRIALPRGQSFTITAKGVSAANKYIQSASLNGKPLDKPWFTHADITGGGNLVLVMGPRPNRAWGAAPDAAPPSGTVVH
jgi:predicted alpha-1,2-mannosidase